MTQPHTSLAAEKIGSIFGLSITNSILMTWMVMIVLTAFAFLISRKISLVPGHFQSIAELTVEGLYGLFRSVIGEVYVASFFPLLATIFLFVLLANWGGLLPGVGTVGKYVAEFANENVPHVQENITFVPFLRGATADLNTTLAIALVAVSAIQYYGVKTLGLPYFKKFINLSNPIMFGVGLLEIISEFSRIISFAFRLFGNIFAGEVLLTVIAFLMPLLAPLPFLGLELFVGFIQALVFSMLTAVFLSMATVSHADH